MEFEIIKRQTIKPSTPTPHYLRNFKLSLLDQLGPVAYEPLVLFYPKNGIATTEKSLWIIKKSLSETLNRFYPLAGRIKGNNSIDCNDRGVDYVDARVYGVLAIFLSKPDADTLRQLLPIKPESPEASRGPLLLVQANVFDCGGLAIGVCMSRKFADASSLSTFIMAWSATALGFSQALLPDFSASFQFPPTDHSSSFQQSSVDVRRVHCVTKRFVFDAPKIADLRTKSASSIVDQPTHAEAVAALIWRCAVAAASRSSSSLQSPKLSLLSQSVDIRKRVVPPLSDDSIGNLVGYFAAQTDETELELQGLVAKLRKGVTELSNSYAKRRQKDQALQVVCNSFKEADELKKKDDIINFYVGTDSCNYKLLYEVNFGWGKPIWLSNVPAASTNNVASLVSTREDGGIEAWVNLSEEDMATFEQDQELLAFAFMNPSVLEVEPITRKSAL